MDGLSFDNILTEDEANSLFDSKEEEVQDNQAPEESFDNNTAEVDPEHLFDDSPESVGSGKDNEADEDTISNESGSSPNFYSSIASALREDGIFPDLDEGVLADIKTPQDFKELIEYQIKEQMTSRQNRVNNVLDIGVPPSQIKQYEEILESINSISEDQLTDESDNGENLRKNLIYQDYLNRGYSKERAEREVNKSINAGTDIEDAREALKSNYEFYANSYNVLINRAEQIQKEELRDRQYAMDSLMDSIMDESDSYSDFGVDKNLRKRVADVAVKPVYRDPETGEYLSEIQRYQQENTEDFIKNVSLIYTLTNGFKDLDNLVRSKVNKGIKRGVAELENRINNTSRTSNGNLRFVSNTGKEPETFFGNGWKLDV